MITIIVQTDDLPSAQRVVETAEALKCLSVVIRDGEVTTLPASGSQQ